MTNEVSYEQKIYLDYIILRLKTLTPKQNEAPPYSFELFKKMWGDRLEAVRTGDKKVEDSITFLLGDKESWNSLPEF